jgi:hypothetical protein
MGERRSPYLILGLPYGASKDDAARAFARATRRLRQHPDAPFDLEDLNWALHAVEQRVEDPAISVDDYRMPGDASVYEVPPGSGILRPPIEPYPRRTAPSTSTERDALALALVRHLADGLADELRQAPLPVMHSFEADGLDR